VASLACLSVGAQVRAFGERKEMCGWFRVWGTILGERSMLGSSGEEFAGIGAQQRKMAIGGLHALSRHAEEIDMLRKQWIATGCAVMLAGGLMVGRKVMAAGPADLAPIGETAPNFTLPSQEGTNVSLSDYKGKWVVLYFYPKDQTSGCTIEAHNFQRDLPKYDALNAVVLGVSLDTVESHKTFCTKDSLTFKLLADPDHKAIDAYGVPVKSMGPMHFAMRDTFLISPEGKIVKQWEVKDIQAHSEDVLATIAAMKK
jgi:peroxiredoxin Q/BCP